jgi:predicted metal-dependent hydrolase
MLSIRNAREMDASKILQTYPSEQSPDTNAYVQALSFIRDYLVDDQLLDNYLDNRYRKKAREILKDYLTRLMIAIEEAARRRLLKITS